MVFMECTWPAATTFQGNEPGVIVDEVQRIVEIARGS